MKKTWKLALFLVSFALLISGCSGNKSPLDPDKPTTITIWHYYNGSQQVAFNALIDEFNKTKGKELGIVVESSSQGTVADLENNVLDAVNKKVGASEVPNIFAAYADTAYAVDKLGYVEDIAPYFTKEEVDKYIDGYIEEGRFSENDSLKIFPIAKSLEVLVVNKTDWDIFANATNAKEEDLKTIEGVVKTAKAYYEWTDSLTPTPNDGKALFGRDAMANYMIIGFKQLGSDLYEHKDGQTSINFDKEIVRKLWDNYYVPYISGYFASTGRFRSDDMKTGNVIAFVGSSSGVTFLPEEVIDSDSEKHAIDIAVYPSPQFADSKGYAVQQGAGMVVTKGEEKEVYASVEFLKWFTDPSRNIEFSVASGYLPVTKEANSSKKIIAEQKDISPIMKQTIEASMDTIDNNTLYTTKVFENAGSIRTILENALSTKAKEDRTSVVNKLASGMSYQEVIATFNTDENFNTWYNNTKAEIEKSLK